MASKRPGFITGANAKIKSNSKTIAYCTDVSYNITVQTIPIEVFGRYEPVSNEPVGYACEGTFNVIRYTKRAQANNNDLAASGKGNQPANVEATSTSTHKDMLNPAEILGSETFDLDIYEMDQAAGAAGASESHVFRVKDCRLTRRGATLTKRGVLVDSYAFVGIIASDSNGSGDLDIANSGNKDQEA